MYTLTTATLRKEIKANPKLSKNQLAKKLGCKVSRIERNLLAITKLEANIIDINKDIKTILAKGKKRNTNTYTNSNGINKELARLKMVSGVLNSGLNGKILSLPYSTWVIEQKITDKTNAYNFLGVECHKQTYNDMKKTIKGTNLPFEVFHGKAEQKIYGVESNTYAHMILDYCGTLPTVMNEIEYALDKKVLQVGGKMYVTLSKAIRSINSNEKLLNIANSIDNRRSADKCASDVVIEGYFNKVVGWSHKIEEIFHYSDVKENGNLTVPMVMVAITRMN
jgi:hypothetical protein